MPYDTYSCLRTMVDSRVLVVTIDHPPINLLDLDLIRDLDRLGRELEQDSSMHVVVFESANAEFFIAHADVRLLQQIAAVPPPATDDLGPFYQMVERFRTLPQATIGKIAGRARGGGSEFLLSLDMRFAARGKTLLAQPEVALGILPGGSGTQRLPRILGRSRALEVILGCADFTAELAELYGYVNRALPPDELAPFVDALARRIASFPLEAIRLAKCAVDAAEGPLIDGLRTEERCFQQALSSEEAQRRMQRFLELGGQTRDVELSLDDLVRLLAGTETSS